MSLASRKNSIIAWKMPLLALGSCTARLRQVATHIGDGEHDAGDDHAERIEPAEERHDDRGEPVVLRKAQRHLPNGPVTSKMPASPASAPDSRNTSHTVAFCEKPPCRAAFGAEPTTRTWKPNTERCITTHIITAMISVNSTPE